jgi:hypothetical protein
VVSLDKLSGVIIQGGSYGSCYDSAGVLKGSMQLLTINIFDIKVKVQFNDKFNYVCYIASNDMGRL